MKMENTTGTDTRDLYNRLRPTKFEDMYRTSDFLSNIVARISKALNKEPGLSHCFLFYSEEPGLGKAQPYDSKVLTPNGWTTMGSIEVGDEVMGEDGRPHRVAGVYERGIRDVVTVRFSDGSFTKCCTEHLWNVQIPNDRLKANGEWRTVETCDLIDRIWTGGKRRFSIPMTIPIEFEEKDLLIPPYTMGALLGDGILQKDRVGISNPEVNILDLISTRLPGDLHLKMRADGTCDYGISLKNGEFRNRDDVGNYASTNAYIAYIKALGLAGKRSYEKFIPQIYKLAGVQQRVDLLQGIMDTDGYISKDGSAVQYSTSSEQLGKDVTELVQSLGGVCRRSVKAPMYTYKGEKMEVRIHYVFNISLPNSIPPFRASWKLERVKERSKYPTRRYITSITPTTAERVRCISTDNPSGLYITDNYIVTHNTTAARILASELNSDLSSEERAALFRGEDNPVCFNINGGEKRKIDDVRELIERIENLRSPMFDYNYVFIIDEIHKLTDDAVDAMLATVENMTQNVYLILTTTDISKMNKAKSPQEMLVSRSEVHKFKSLSKVETSRLLVDISKAQKYSVLEDRIIDAIYSESGGRPRRAVTLLSQYMETGMVGTIEEEEGESIPYFKDIVAGYNKVIFSKGTWAKDVAPIAMKMLNEYNAEDARIRLMQRLFYEVMDPQQGVKLPMAKLLRKMGEVFRDPVVPPQKSDMVARLYAIFLEALELRKVEEPPAKPKNGRT